MIDDEVHTLITKGESVSSSRVLGRESEAGSLTSASSPFDEDHPKDPANPEEFRIANLSLDTERRTQV